MPTIARLETDAERERAVPILRQLWTRKEPEEVLGWTGRDDYHLVGRVADGELVAVAGFLVREVLHHERHVWLYDLVVDEPHRGEGHGSALLEYVESWADDNDCEAVALASPTGKHEVHEYYEARDYERWGYVVEKSL